MKPEPQLAARKTANPPALSFLSATRSADHTLASRQCSEGSSSPPRDVPQSPLKKSTHIPDGIRQVRSSVDEVPQAPHDAPIHHRIYLLRRAITDQPEPFFHWRCYGLAIRHALRSQIFSTPSISTREAPYDGRLVDSSIWVRGRQDIAGIRWEQWQRWFRSANCEGGWRWASELATSHQDELHGVGADHEDQATDEVSLGGP
jgi:hypothetical protein